MNLEQLCVLHALNYRVLWGGEAEVNKQRGSTSVFGSPENINEGVGKAGSWKPT